MRYGDFNGDAEAYNEALRQQSYEERIARFKFGLDQSVEGDKKLDAGIQKLRDIHQQAIRRQQELETQLEEHYLQSLQQIQRQASDLESEYERMMHVYKSVDDPIGMHQPVSQPEDPRQSLERMYRES